MYAWQEARACCNCLNIRREWSSQELLRRELSSQELLRTELFNQELLTLSTLGKIFGRHYIELFFFFFSPENGMSRLVQIVSCGDNLHEMSNPVFWEK